MLFFRNGDNQDTTKLYNGHVHQANILIRSSHIKLNHNGELNKCPLSMNRQELEIEIMPYRQQRLFSDSGGCYSTHNRLCYVSARFDCS